MAKAPADLRSLARAHTELSVQTLAGIARNGTSEQARVAASQALLDRGWGRPPQVHSGEDGGDLRITIRQIVDITGDTERLIEHEPDRRSR
jgi:hypothetical protein